MHVSKLCGWKYLCDLRSSMLSSGKQEERDHEREEQHLQRDVDDQCCRKKDGSQYTCRQRLGCI